MSFTTSAAELTAELERLVETHGIPGISAAILRDGEIIAAAAGVTNVETGVETDVDTVCQIGSVTKIWTATLIMQLVDEGLLNLDAPVHDVVPEFTISDSSAASVITTRNLLAHTAGFDGDRFDDTGRGDDATALYLEAIADAAQIFPPGERFSYCNAGYVVLGRIIEKLRGCTYNQAVQRHLARPLGLTHVATDVWEAIRFRAAYGHMPSPDGPVLAPFWSMGPSNAPAGCMLAMTTSDLVRFGQMHLNDGVGTNGARVLSVESAQAMREEQVATPPIGNPMGHHWGLGWSLFDFDGSFVFGHDGGTVGQGTTLRVLPEHGVIYAVCVNGPGASLVFDAISRDVAASLGLELEPLPMPVENPVPADVARLGGKYLSPIAHTEVLEKDGKLYLHRVPFGPALAMGAQEDTIELLPWREDVLLMPLEKDRYMPVAFIGDDGSGRAQYMHTGRADRRATE